MYDINTKTKTHNKSNNTVNDYIKDFKHIKMKIFLSCFSHTPEYFIVISFKLNKVFRVFRHNFEDHFARNWTFAPWVNIRSKSSLALGTKSSNLKVDRPILKTHRQEQSKNRLRNVTRHMGHPHNEKRKTISLIIEFIYKSSVFYLNRKTGRTIIR